MEINEIQKIYEKFDNVGCLTFATVNDKGEPETRIAHLRAYDNDGIYFMTMFTKSFYEQMKKTGKVSVCGLCANTKVQHTENGSPIFEGGYAIRMTGDVKEVSIDEIKAKNNPAFNFCIADQEKYNAMVVLCITNAHGDIFDYDFAKENRDTKLERIYFSYNNDKVNYKGLKIDESECISCGKCKAKCSFLAIDEVNGKFCINNTRCDECGDCYMVCPVKAVKLKF